MQLDNRDDVTGGKGPEGAESAEQSLLKGRIAGGAPDFDVISRAELFEHLESDLAQMEKIAEREAREDVQQAAQRMERLKKTAAPAASDDEMYEGGVGRLWELRQAQTALERERDAAMEQRIFRRECTEKGDVAALELENEREAFANAAEWHAEPPLWQQISGLISGAELRLNPAQRAAGIRRLLKKVERMIRFEVRAGEKDGRGETATGRLGDGETGGSGEEEGERQHAGWKPALREVDACRKTAQWDPLQPICTYLGIAPRKLSALSREISGLSVTQLADAIKAETLRKKMMRRVAEWVASIGDVVREAGADLQEQAYALWKRLRGERQKNGSHRSSVAWELGFSSYTRMFRACLVCYGLVPQEIELELIAERLGCGEERAQCVPGQIEAESSRTDLPLRHEATKGHEGTER